MKPIGTLEQTDDFYGDLEKGNAVVHQQARNNIMLAITSKVTDGILNGDDPEKSKELMSMLQSLREGTL